MENLSLNHLSNWKTVLLPWFTSLGRREKKGLYFNKYSGLAKFWRTKNTSVLMSRFIWVTFFGFRSLAEKRGKNSSSILYWKWEQGCQVQQPVQASREEKENRSVFSAITTHVQTNTDTNMSKTQVFKRCFPQESTLCDLNNS